jgi:hypothetical protein
MKYSNVTVLVCVLSLPAWSNASSFSFTEESGVATSGYSGWYDVAQNQQGPTLYTSDYATQNKFNEVSGNTLSTFNLHNGADNLTGSYQADTETEVESIGNLTKIRANMFGEASLSGPDPSGNSFGGNFGSNSQAQQDIYFNVFSPVNLTVSWTSTVTTVGSVVEANQLFIRGTNNSSYFGFLGTATGSEVVHLAAGHYYIEGSVYGFGKEQNGGGSSASYRYGSFSSDLSFTISGLNGSTSGAGTATPGPASALTPALFGLASAWRRRKATR